MTNKLAVIRTGGKQYLVQEGDIINVEKIEGEGNIKLSDVLFYSDGKSVNSDKKDLAGINIEAKILRQFRAPKISVIKFKSKKRYRRQSGHRQLQTELQITKI